VPVSELHDVLPHADYVVISAPQTTETAKLMGAKEIALMKKGACLVYVSRGAFVEAPDGHVDGLVGTLVRRV
jgi:phosphoglycerate dehydrogenase-like enzyme